MRTGFLSALPLAVLLGSPLAQAQTEPASGDAAVEAPAADAPAATEAATDSAETSPGTPQAEPATEEAAEASTPDAPPVPAAAADGRRVTEEADGEDDSAPNEAAATEPAAADSAASDSTASDSAADEVTDEDLQRFLDENNMQADGGLGPSLKFYGFADFTYGQYLIPDDSPWRLLYNSNGSFSVGNLNLYMDAQLHETVRSLAEVRFTYLPHGNVVGLGPPVERQINNSSDYTRNERDIVVGGIRIERAWLQWSPHQLVQLKFGHWLTPYGIWNVDHGSPTIIPVTRPFIIDEFLLPEAQTGILLEGRFDAMSDLAIVYGLGISNGRGPIDTYYDFDSNRGITGRLKIEYSKLGELAVGASTYVGQYTDARADLTIDGGSLQSFDIINQQYDEFSVAADLRWEYKGFLFQSEFMLNDRAFTEEGRINGAAPDSFAPDNRRWGIYGLTGYRFNWLGIMPYVIAEYAPIPSQSVAEIPREVVLLGGGINVRPIAPVAVKVGFDSAIFPENRPGTFDEHTLNRLQAQVAWAF